MKNLSQKSSGYKKTADKVLKAKQIVNSLSKFGEVIFTGAYKYNLMLNGDVDIYVVRDKKYNFQEVLEIFNKIVLENKFRSYFIKGDWDDIRLGKTFPQGQYIGFKEKINKEAWKFDIWFIDQKELVRLQKVEPQNVSDKDKELILKIKEYRNHKDLRLSGLEIYQNVLSKKWKSFSNFKSNLLKVS